MKKATLFLGLFYLAWGIWQLFTMIRLSSLYQQFSAEQPQNLYLLPISTLLFGIIFAGSYFINIKNQIIYKLFTILAVAGIVTWIGYVVVSGSIANEKINKIFQETKQLQK